MPKYDVRVTVDFNGVEADDEESLQEIVDNAMGEGAVIFKHPTTGDDITSDYSITERE